MITIVKTKRKSAVLSPSSLACLAHIPAINLTFGCVHDCLYCYARGYSVFPGENKIVVYENSLEQINMNSPGRKSNREQCILVRPVMFSNLYQKC